MPHKFANLKSGESNYWKHMRKLLKSGGGGFDVVNVSNSVVRAKGAHTGRAY